MSISGDNAEVAPKVSLNSCIKMYSVIRPILFILIKFNEEINRPIYFETQEQTGRYKKNKFY